MTFNTNAKVTTASPDRLKKIFAERPSHRVLAEQKVSDWLLKYRSYSHIPPKDMTDIPDNLWSPQEVESNSKNNSAIDSMMHKSDKESNNDQFEKKDIKGGLISPAFGGKAIHPYFSSPPYRKVGGSLRKTGDSTKSVARGRLENFMDVKRGMLRGSRRIS
ncbi:hypothetical protein Aperf_G00000004043 [Anoplocephala perfoliata]